MENLLLGTFLLLSFTIFFIFVRGSVIDLETEYVPDNIVIGTYLCSILFVISACVIENSIGPLIKAFLGFFIAFIIPFAMSNFVYYIRYFAAKRKLKKIGHTLEIAKEEVELTENPTIPKKTYILCYSISFLLIVIFSLLLKRLYFIPFSIVAAFSEYALFKLLKRFYVIKVNYAEKKFEEKTEKEEFEEDLEFGIGYGDILLFGSIGIFFSLTGFLIVFAYSVIAHVCILIIYSIVKKINPFDYCIPFIPALSVGILIYITGMDKIFFNFNSIFLSIFA